MISVFLSAYYDIRKEFKVSKNCFVPVPKVDSAVISLKKNIKISNDISISFEKFIKDAFKYKRKNLRNNLFGYDLNKIEEILVNNGYSLSSRAEDIDLNTFIEIAKNL